MFCYSFRHWKPTWVHCYVIWYPMWSCSGRAFRWDDFSRSLSTANILWLWLSKGEASSCKVSVNRLLWATHPKVPVPFHNCKHSGDVLAFTRTVVVIELQVATMLQVTEMSLDKAPSITSPARRFILAKTKLLPSPRNLAQLPCPSQNPNQSCISGWWAGLLAPGLAALWLGERITTLKAALNVLWNKAEGNGFCFL